jgi:hypothetical protein
MVSVRISKDIIDEMKKAAEEKFLLSDPKPTNKTELTDLILQAMRDMPVYKKALTLVNEPEVVSIRNTPYSGSIRSVLDYLGSTNNVHELQVSGLQHPTTKQDYTFSAHLKIPVTMFFSPGYARQMTVHINHIAEPTRQTLIDEINASLADVHAWQERYNEYTTRVNTLFNACKSTKQLLDAWPAAEVFLPKVVVDKMQNKVVNTADLDAKAKRDAFSSDGLEEHILIAGILQDVSGNKGNI